MQDQFLMTQLLDESKSICNLLNNGTLEADDSVLQSCFKKVLTNYLSLQHEIYKSMQEMGWYPMENVKQQAIDKVKKKFEEKKEK
jgi:spore coat protein CotF